MGPPHQGRTGDMGDPLTWRVRCVIVPFAPRGRSHVGPAKVHINREKIVNKKSNDNVHLYVDLANIWAGAQAVAAELGDPRLSVRLSAEGLRSVMAANREVVGTTLVANVGVPEPVRRHFE